MITHFQVLSTKQIAEAQAELIRRMATRMQETTHD